ncbi:MAG: AfsR/SARP family transcriptional regulator, partial [Syntrophothermus sp.]
MSPCFEARLFGRFEISYADRSLSRPATLKSQSLLAYLILHRKTPQRRDVLCNLFWGDRPESRARGSLSTALWQIHRCLPEGEFLLSNTETVQFNPSTMIWIDVEEFVSKTKQEEMDALSSGIALYTGEFLAGFEDDWVIDERYLLESLYRSTLARLMAVQEAKGKKEAALTTARLLLEQDPLQEDAHRLAMRVYCQLGQRNA